MVFHNPQKANETKGKDEKVKIEIHTLTRTEGEAALGVQAGGKDLRSFTYQQTQTEHILRNVIVMTFRAKKGCNMEFSVIMCVEAVRVGMFSCHSFRAKFKQVTGKYLDNHWKVQIENEKFQGKS